MTDTPNEAVAAYLTSIYRIDANGTGSFHDPLYGPFISTGRAGCPAMSASEVAAWTKVNRPDLWGHPETTPVAPPTAPSTAADVMAAVRSGALSEDAGLAAMRALSAKPERYAPVPYQPRTTASLPPQSLSSRMVAAKNDPAALATLRNSLGLN